MTQGTTMPVFEKRVVMSSATTSSRGRRGLQAEDLGKLAMEHEAAVSPTMRLCLRNGFIDVENGPELERRVRSSSAPPSRTHPAGALEQPNYIQELEDRTLNLRSSMKKQVDRDGLLKCSTSDSGTASSTTASIGSGSSSSAESNTSFMLGPPTQKDICAAMDHMGFEGTYLFCHVPNANKKKPRATNLGYA
eukprot:CAMPEP_0170616102 /NCGR_PEP_ID=MMETSP0224-20130122/25696_1 /TAXON_ID=285029 /ORGANISM="Togula jolla, Strain CCCM 725" /LENGTH=191 /DNA_ID=CAMNT_0010941887 /DNA_START=24 /DNA_END=596 /DNA_ORIENTATION=+